MQSIQHWFGKWLLLTLFWFVLNSIDFSQLQLTDFSKDALIGRAMMSILDSLILCWILARSSKRGSPLVLVIFLAVFGMKIGLTVIEAAYLPVLRPIIFSLIMNGAISSLLWSLTAVAFTVGFSNTSLSLDRLESLDWQQKWFQWILKSLLLAILWMVLFVIFGVFVFMNLARLIDPQALATYSNLDMPAWVLPFQGFRALLWLGLSLPLLMQLRGSLINVMILTASIFGIWMGSNLFLAFDLPVGLRYAHLAEVMVECFVFGALVVAIFAWKPHTPFVPSEQSL